MAYSFISMCMPILPLILYSFFSFLIKLRRPAVHIIPQEEIIEKVPSVGDAVISITPYRHSQNEVKGSAYQRVHFKLMKRYVLIFERCSLKACSRCVTVQHPHGTGAIWTHKYGVIAIVDVCRQTSGLYSIDVKYCIACREKTVCSLVYSLKSDDGLRAVSDWDG